MTRLADKTEEKPLQYANVIKFKMFTSDFHSLQIRLNMFEMSSVKTVSHVKHI